MSVVNSWLDNILNQDNPCISNPEEQTPTTPIPTTNNYIIWLVAGVLIGSLVFQKKKGANQ